MSDLFPQGVKSIVGAILVTYDIADQIAGANANERNFDCGVESFVSTANVPIIFWGQMYHRGTIVRVRVLFSLLKLDQ
jgi:hypothetical protein